MINPWMILGVVLAWLASLVSVGGWQNHEGKVSERIVWQGKESKELSEANSLIQTLQTSAREKEYQKAEDTAQISKSYQAVLTAEGLKNEKIISDLRNGIIRLRQPSTPSPRTDSNTTSETTPATSGCNGETGSELSAGTSGFLYSKAARADKIVEQLTACQQIVTEDRK